MAISRFLQESLRDRFTSASGPALGRWDWVVVALVARVELLAGPAATVFDGLGRLCGLFFFGRIAQHEFSGRKIPLLIPLPTAGSLAAADGQKCPIGLLPHSRLMRHRLRVLQEV